LILHRKKEPTFDILEGSRSQLLEAVVVIPQ
jgi:hypothetical protein